MAFGKKKKDKKPVKKQWVKCNGTWTEKRMINGRWMTFTRYCSREQGHSGAHR